VDGDTLSKKSVKESIENYVKITPPSVVEMLQELEKEKYVVYKPRRGARLTDEGRKIA